MANRENIQKWVDALRSGEYAQTKGVLYRKEPGRYEKWDAGIRGYESVDAPTGYCCLGVLCDIAEKNGVDFSDTVEVYDLETDDVVEVTRAGDWWRDDVGSLPVAAQDWLGILDDDPELFFDEDKRWTAAGANDELGLTFAEIADKVEAKWLKDSDPVE